MANLKYKNNNNEWKSILSTRGPKGDNADITINGSNSKEVSFYAPTSSGLVGQALISKGANQSPQWTNLAVVAGTNSYNDLDNKPTIPTTTEELISGSTSVLTSGGAYNAFAQRGIPSGGAEGQVIKKASATDYDFSWADACIDNLTSTSITTPLSANQGKILNDKFSNYLPLSGGATTGAIKMPYPQDRVYIGSQQIYSEFSGSGEVAKTALIGAYNYRTIEGIFAEIDQPAGWHREYRLTFQGTTGAGNSITVYLNNIAARSICTYSGKTFREISASNFFKAEQITLETPLNYSSPLGINLYYSVSGEGSWSVYGVYIHGFFVKD